MRVVVVFFYIIRDQRRLHVAVGTIDRIVLLSIISTTLLFGTSERFAILMIVDRSRMIGLIVHHAGVVDGRITFCFYHFKKVTAIVVVVEHRK